MPNPSANGEIHVTDNRSHREVSTSTVGSKIGLALSGGGVQAAVFHLGVLGRLA
jgi:hypothetical protein